MSNAIEQEARSLWLAWQEEQAQGMDFSRRFTDQVERLLSKRSLEDVLDSLFSLRAQIGADDDVNELIDVAHGQSWAAEITETHTAVLVALPIMGETRQLAASEAFWQQVQAYLQGQARLFLRLPTATLPLVPLGDGIHPEAAAMIKTDDWRELLLELAHERPGGCTQRVQDCEKVAKQMDIQSTTLSRHVSVYGQRVAIAALVVDETQWGSMDAFITFMVALGDQHDWPQKFVRPDRMVMPPMTLAQAMGECLSYHMINAVTFGLEHRGMAFPNTSFDLGLEILDDGETSGVMEIGLSVNDVMLDPVLVPSAWLATLGEEGFRKSIEMTASVLRQQAEQLSNEAEQAQETDDYVPTSAPKRHRLH